MKLAQEQPAAGCRAVAAAGLPDSIDHRVFYGPIRDQAYRGTCVSFATTAAVEGMYGRLDPVRFKDLDLSEQWANHVQKMVLLATSKYCELDIPQTMVTQVTVGAAETPTGRCRGGARVLSRRQPPGPAKREETRHVRDDQRHRLVRDRH